MLFSVIVGILAFIGFAGAVGMVIGKNATIVVGALVGVAALACILTSFGIGFAGVVWASFGAVSLVIGTLTIFDAV